MQDHLIIFSAYALMGAFVAWTLIRGVNEGWLAGENYHYTADDNPIGFSLAILLRVVVVVACFAGCAFHLFGWGQDPVMALGAFSDSVFGAQPRASSG
jgi:hypothetical protein